MSHIPTEKLSLIVLATLAVAFALGQAENIAAPLALAFVTGMVLGPINGRIQALGVGPTFSAILTLAGALAMIVGAAFLFRPWITEAIDSWPQLRLEMRKALFDIRVHLNGLFDIQREVMSAIDPTGGSEAGGGSGDDVPTLSDAAWMAPQAIAQFVLFVGGLFFFLLGKTDLYTTLDRLELCPESACIAAEARVAHYFGTITIINLGFGTAVALALSLIGLPGAPLWGLVAALANFVIYLGAALTAVALVIAGTVSFDGIAVFLPAAIFVTLNGLEGQFVTPMLLGRQMRLNPLLVFVSLAFWLWLWGPIGGIVAIPLLLWGLEMWKAVAAQPDA